MMGKQGRGSFSSDKAGGSTGAKKKKMVIKPFKVQPKLPENFEDSTWEKLQRAVAAIQTKEPTATSREELYRAVEDLCVHKMGAKLYDRLREECGSHTRKEMESLQGQTPDCNAFLQLVDQKWQDHCSSMLTLRNVFLYLDRSFVLQTPSLRSIWDMGLELFRTYFQANALEEVEAKTVAGILSLVERERTGVDVNRALLRSLLRMLSALQVYEELFEGRFLRETEEFYAAEGVRYMETADVPHFLQHVADRLQQEADRASLYLDSSTRKLLIAKAEGHLLKPHTQALLERGFANLMDSQRLPELKMMYQLFQRVQALDELKAAMTAHVQSRGLYIVHDKDNDKEMVSNLLAFRAKLDVCLNTACDGNEAYRYKLKEAWEAFLNARQNRPAELMAKFLDVKLKGEKGMSDDDVESVLDKVMVLFRYLQGKDVFEAFYKRDLAKRLLLGKSSSFDLEKSMISKLKTECGSAFTSKLEGMFKDIDLSRDLMTAYSQHLKTKLDDRTVFRLDKSREMDLHVQVLTTGYWPAYPAMEVGMPEEMKEHVECFKCYYQNKYQGRRLVWQPVLGQCILKVAFPKGRKELAVSQLQTLVLWCFSTADEVSFVDVRAKTNIEDGELRRTLQSLACGKVRVLHKEPRGREVNDGDRFLFNKEFTAKLHRIRINSIQLKETTEENEKTHEAVFRERQYQVDAAIVRIMKARKNLAHTLLMSELFSQVKFPATPVDLKKRIESLIERDYLERDPTKPGNYRYLA
ncbi:unnamed protein product [Pylaiella littoralis]